MSLTDVLPVFAHFGLEVTVQRPYELDGEGARTSYIYDFGLRAPGPDVWSGRGGRTEEEVAAAFEDAFTAVWSGAAESDRLNALVLTAGLHWRDVVILRALARYVRAFNGVKAACFPCGTGLGATFNQELLEEAGKKMGEEGKWEGSN